MNVKDKTFWNDFQKSRSLDLTESERQRICLIYSKIKPRSIFKMIAVIDNEYSKN